MHPRSHTRPEWHARAWPAAGRTFDEVLATIPYSKTFEINGVDRTYHFTEEERISCAREELARERDKIGPLCPWCDSPVSKTGDFCQACENNLSVTLVHAPAALGLEADMSIDGLARAMIDLNAEHAHSGGCTEERLLAAGFTRDFLDANKAEATRRANLQFARQDAEGPAETQGERLIRMREAVAQLLPSRAAIVGDLVARGFSRRETETMLNAAVNFATRDFLHAIRTGAN